MRRKRKLKSFISGMLAGLTMISTMLSPMTTFAAEPIKEKIPPLFEEVKDLLSDDEVVTATDLEITKGQEFDIEKDMTGIEIVDKEKVKVVFHEAKSENGKDFDVNHEDVYHAVYYVEPVNEHPMYQISRNITVKEPEQKSQSNEQSNNSKDEEKSAEDDDSHSEDPVILMNDEISTYANPSGLIVKNATPRNPEWQLPLLDYIYSTETGDTVSNFVKYIANDAANGWRLAFCTELNKHFIDSTEYIGQTWKQNGMYSEISYAIAHGCGKYLDLNDSAYSTGDWMKDYYVTQTVIYCILSDYGFDGHSIGSLRSVSGYKDVYDCSHAMYNDVKKNAGKDGYGDNPVYKIQEPSYTKMLLSQDKKSYESGWYSVTVSGEVQDAKIYLEGAPDGAEIVYEHPGKTNSRFYVRIPVEKTYNLNEDKIDFKIKSTAHFNRPYTYIYESKIADAQNITFEEKYVPSQSINSSAKGSLVLEKCNVSIKKTDEETGQPLSGAIYGLYSDADCKNLVVTMPATDEEGTSSVSIRKSQDTLYLKEITATKGYVVDTKAYNVKLVLKDNTHQDVTDKEQLAKLTIYKTGEMLTGAKVTETGVEFIYQEQRLKGAKFNVYAAEDIKTPTGKAVYNKGDLVAENLTTDDSGSVSLNKLHLGSYKIKEMTAPDNYVNDGKEQIVTISYAGQDVETVFTETTIPNERQKAEVTVTKLDDRTENPLHGGEYSLYANEDISDMTGKVVVKKGTLIETVTTGEDGKATFTADLPINYSYYVTETKAPAMYRRNTEDRFGFDFKFTTDKEQAQSFEHVFKNERVDAKLSLVKKDTETSKAQGDASLEGAVYGLYAREDIVHPDGETGVIYPAGTKITELTTDKEGKAEVKNLYLGNYYVKEIQASEGYLLDETEYDINLEDEGDLTNTVKRECVSLETVKKQPFQIIKAADNGKTDADLLKGAGFTAYLVSDLKVNKDGSYDFESAKPVVIGENGATEIFTDEKGHAVSIPLPYGTYVVRETTTPHNYEPVDDFIVKITENKPNEPQTWRVLLDKEFEAKLKITKKDDETNKSVLQENTAFKIFNMDTKKYVEQVTTYPNVVKHDVFYTNEEGFLILPQALKIGHYRVEEVEAPNGYTVNENYVEIHVDSNTAHQMEETSKDMIISVEYENHPVKGEISIVKTGEKLVDFKHGKFVFEEQPLKDAEFEIIADEDIYTPDYQKDANGNRIVIYEKGSVITTVKTDKEGKAKIEDLPLGKYLVREIHAPEGFVLNTTPQRVELNYKDQETPIVKEEVSFVDDRQKLSLKVQKQDEDTGKTLKDAVFALYTEHDIIVNDKVIIKADTKLEEATTDENGNATFAMDLPFADYYVKEVKAPAGYVSSDEVLKFATSYQGENKAVAEYDQIKQNKPTVFEFTKSDATTGVEIEGAKLTVLDKKGNVIDTWTSKKDEAHVIKNLVVGETYILREELAPYGYLKATEIEFTVEDTAKIQKVEMKDEVPTGKIIINKEGEFLEKISLVDTVKGWIEHLFEYVFGNLTPVTFEIYAREDIKAADGVSDDYFKAGDLIGEITTDEKGIATMEELPLGKYYVVEKETAEGYVLDKEPRNIDLVYQDQDTPVVTYTESWQNARQKIEVSVVKKEKGTDTVLEGGTFALYTAEDILSSKGEVLMKADTIIEQKVTDEEGKLTFKADLPIGGKYYVKEVKAPAGFVTSDEKQEFVFKYEGSDKEKVEVAFTFENEPTKAEISKTDITGTHELPGAKLTILDKDEQVIESWTSTDKPHYIEKLPEGEYTLREETAPKGYIIAEDVKFEIKDNGDIQKVMMKDDVAKGKVILDKKDAASGKPLKGVEFELRDSEGNVLETLKTDDAGHAESKLYDIATFKDGVFDKSLEYTLVETKPLKGYVLDPTEHEVIFEYVDDHTPIIEVKYDLSNKLEDVQPEKPVGPVSNSPKTGDTNNILFPVVLAVASATAAMIVVIKKKKRK